MRIPRKVKKRVKVKYLRNGYVPHFSKYGFSYSLWVNFSKQVITVKPHKGFDRI